MENILILTYYYPPCQGVAAYRPLSWANNFHLHGLKPTIITRHWSGNENSWHDYLKECGTKPEIKNAPHSTTIRLPYKKNKWIRLTEKKWIKNSGLDKIIYLFLALTGNVQTEIDAYSCFKDYLFEHLKTKSYKLIIVTSPPLNIIRLAQKIHKQFNIPFVVDFQDSWNNMLLGEKYEPGRKERFYNSVKQFYLKKWLKNATFTTTVTPAIGELIEKINSKPIEIITNGFEKEAYNLKNKLPNTTFFNVSVMGTIHPIQDITIMLQGLKLFLKDKNSQKVKLNFIGLDAFPKMSELVRTTLPEAYITITSRVSMDEAVERTLAANVLLFPSYKGYKGYYTAKIFEYLGAERNILMVPGNNDIVDELIHKTQSGKIANSENEFMNILNSWYNEWEKTGTLKYNGIKENIQFFSRENQDLLLCNAIKKHLA